MAVISQRWNEIGEGNQPRELTFTQKLLGLGACSLVIGGVIYGAASDMVSSKEAREQRSMAIEKSATLADGFSGSEYLGDNKINLVIEPCTLLGVEIETVGSGSEVDITSYAYEASPALRLDFGNIDELQAIVGGSPCAVFVDGLAG